MKFVLPNKFLFFLLLTFFSVGLNCVAQDIHFSQFYETPLLRNPALAGIFTGDVRFQAVYRTQWQSVTTPYQTGSFNGEFKLPIGKGNDFITLGGEILYDKAGTIALQSTQVLPAMNYHKSLSDDRNMYLSLGFMAGLVQRSLDPSKITTNNQFDGITYNPAASTGENFARTSYSYFDGSVGLTYNTQLGDNPNNNIFLGAAYFHFNKAASISFYNNPSISMVPKWVYSGGVRMSTTDNSYITFQGNYSTQGTYTETMGGAVYTFNLEDADNPRYLLDIGVMIRLNDAIIPVAKLTMKPISIAFSYDANISELAAASNGVGGFELGISYQNFFQNNSSKNAVRCPRF